jgi:hypothetical protein
VNQAGRLTAERIAALDPTELVSVVKQAEGACSAKIAPPFPHLHHRDPATPVSAELPECAVFELAVQPDSPPGQAGWGLWFELSAG